ncbi:hypothetical protein A1F94_009106 [Pyrenophora tritici-repentis]|uniref:Uncharacterized protein n=3 Tax=Pyrenophora tritici-repentis TaxID=45151 RepID=A0A2W1DCK5_9PLEO|nr:uncharacterized protein PTRG_06593 [Pyrenophora tritici-repentis Pt-1C-BFP]KAG9380211.1 hypothetical protein A1F94_009106 [Pyrenophora tritici-repentis]EDU49513.1 conserved hypothetical protein [Pyrenophora tritici-repentis Pt-1C-BFP]KAI1512723.1 hypothetical protein Ptr86124_008689 [Pyrenophora tritici-repentis]KAI1565369.1 hypothetical protein PtrEW4_008275 [Pyrenophora tritici-repentis]KAI1665522.1 hypothetical protein L13192_10463 [Pyrenophora tritici-repentis]
MTFTQRIVLVASSVSLLLLIALSLATSIEVRGASIPIIQISLAQAARLPQNDDLVAQKGLLNGTDFDRTDVFNGTNVVDGVTLETSSTMDSAEGMIGSTPQPKSSAGWADEGVLGPKPTPKPSAKPQPPSDAQIPIVALTYSGAGGPKHCRGELLAKTFLPRPVEKWKNGTCINLPSEARCGVFFSSKGDNCEAALFNMPDCYNTTRTYVNTVVFMPEERAVGALWSSMFLRCGIDVPEAKMLDPAILGGALKPKPKPGGG